MLQKIIFHFLFVRFFYFLILLIIWDYFSVHGMINPFYLPGPRAIYSSWAELFSQNEIYKHILATSTAGFLGLLGGIFFGVTIGFASCLIKPLADIFEPLMILLNAIPRVILAPLFVIWLGIGIESKVGLSMVLVSVLIFFAVYGGIKNVDTKFVNRVRTLGGKTHNVLIDVYLPSVFMWIIYNFKVAVGFAFTGAIVGEFVASGKGLGYLLQFAQSTYNASLTISLILLILLIVSILFGVAKIPEIYFLRWQKK